MSKVSVSVLGVVLGLVSQLVIPKISLFDSLELLSEGPLGGLEPVMVSTLFLAILVSIILLVFNKSGAIGSRLILFNSFYFGSCIFLYLLLFVSLLVLSKQGLFPIY